MSNWCVYLVRCSDFSLYCGIAKDINDRIRQHNLGKGAKYTRCRLPVQLVYLEKVKDRSSALKREFQIKQFSRCEKLRLIKPNEGILEDEETI